MDHLAPIRVGLDTLHEAVRAWLDTADPEPADATTRFTQPDALASAAHWYATNGIPVFPCQYGGKKPATRNGFKAATTNLDQVDYWWKENPQYNIAIPTGVLFDVIDIDHPTAAWRRLRDEIDTGELPNPGLITHTPRGIHLYIPAAPETGNATNVYPGIDYRGTGGYVLAPPSRIDSAYSHAPGRYRWAGMTWPTATQLTQIKESEQEAA